MRQDQAPFFVIRQRLSEVAGVERVWSAHNERAGEFLSIAASTCELVVSRYRSRTLLTVRGPETRMTTCDCPPEGEWLGIRITVGTFLPELPPAALSDRKDVTLPDASARSFWLNGSARCNGRAPDERRDLLERQIEHVVQHERETRRPS